MIYGSLQAEFMTKGHIRRYGTPIFGDIVVYVSKQIKMIIKCFGGYQIKLD